MNLGVIVLNKYTIIFYNRFACETQRFQTEAKNKLSARHKFWQEYPRKSYHDCIENIYEDSISKEANKNEALADKIIDLMGNAWSGYDIDVFRAELIKLLENS